MYSLTARHKQYSLGEERLHGSRDYPHDLHTLPTIPTDCLVDKSLSAVANPLQTGSMLIGYTRVSLSSQSLDLQIEALVQAG